MSDLSTKSRRREPPLRRRVLNRRDERLEFRLTPEARERIEKAAVLNGQTLSDFASSVLLRQANDVLENHAQRMLSESEWMRFVQLVSRPARPNRALKNAAARYKRGHIGEEGHTFSLDEK